MFDKKKSGFILPLTVMLVFAMTFLVTRLVTRAYANVRVNRSTIEREQAKELALGGVALMQAQLAHGLKSQKNADQQKKTGQKTGDDKEKESFVKKFLQIINRWQSFTLTEKNDGIDGTLKLYVACEDGKIPLNALWDFKNKKFVKQGTVDIRKLLEDMVLKQTGAKTGERQLVQELEKVLKQQKEPLEDVSQLFANDYFKGLANSFFVQAPTDKKADKKSDKQTGLALHDIFTVAHDRLKLQPIFLSAGLQKLFDFKGLPSDEQQRNETVKTLADALPKSLGSLEESSEAVKINWENDWNRLLSKVYGKSYDKVDPALKVLFDSAVGATTISVLSYGTVGSVTQKVLAVLQQVVSDQPVAYVVRKLYWL